MIHVRIPGVSMFWQLIPTYIWMRGLSNNIKVVFWPHNRGCTIIPGNYMGTSPQQYKLIPKIIYTYWLHLDYNSNLKLPLSALISIPYLHLLDVLSELWSQYYKTYQDIYLGKMRLQVQAYFNNHGLTPPTFYKLHSTVRKKPKSKSDSLKVDIKAQPSEESSKTISLCVPVFNTVLE